MPSDLQITNIRDQANANSAITIGSDGQITVAQNNPTITLGSNATLGSTVSLANASFPSGHVIQTFTDTYTRSSGVTHSTSQSMDYGSNLSVTIKPTVAAHKIIIMFNIPDVNNASTSGGALHVGMRKSSDGFSSNDTQFGDKEFPWAFVNYTNKTDNLLYAGTLTTVGTLDGTDTFTLRPAFQSHTGSPTSFTNSSSSAFNVASLVVMEIQS